MNHGACKSFAHISGRAQAIRYGSSLGAWLFEQTLEDVQADQKDASALEPDWHSWDEYCGTAVSIDMVPQRWQAIACAAATRSAVKLAERYAAE